MSDPILAALRRCKPARVVVVSENTEREIALRGAGGPGGAGRWQRAAATARALASDDVGARVELRDATGHVLAALTLDEDGDDDDDDNARLAPIVLAAPDQRDERMLTLLVSAQRAALEEQRVLLGPVLQSYTELAHGYAAYAAQVVELVRVAATVRAEMDERPAAAQPGADHALMEMLSRLPMAAKP